MSELTDDNIDEHSGAVLPRQPERPLAPTRMFAPWHEPRKQWIRLYQWRDEVERLFRKLHFPAGSEVLRYLGMPGEDMLDIRLLRELCESKSVDLHYTGIVSAGRDGDRTQLNISDTAMRRLPNVHRSSQIVIDRFEAIGKTTPAQLMVRNAGPYHIINADLTGHIAEKAPTGVGQTYLEAIAEIVSQQIKKASHPWLLFLTTRVEAAHVHTSYLKAFVEAVRSNMDASVEFTSELKKMLDQNDEDLSALLDSPGALPLLKFQSLFCLSFGKWLLAYVQTGTPKHSVEMLESCFYSVTGNNPDMLSLGYLIAPVNLDPNDSNGLLINKLQPPVLTEVELGLKILETTSKLIDLDDKMRNDPTLKELMIIESLILLRQANYPVQENGKIYRDWLSGRSSQRTI